LRQFAGDSGVQLFDLLRTCNGFTAFDGALHVFPYGSSKQGFDLVQWNQDHLWRFAYRDFAIEHVFFAEDAFGGQFSLKDGSVWSFEPETGESEVIASDLEAWSQVVLDDIDVMTGRPLAIESATTLGALEADRRLVPKLPIVLGGEYELANLYLGDPVEAMRFRGDIALQIRDLPEGAEVDLVLKHAGKA